MRLVLLGTTGYHPNDRRETACLLIPEQGVMLDAGTAFYRAAPYLRGSQLDIFLTHAHLDHVVGLTYVFDLLRASPVRQVRVHGEADKLAAFQEHILAPPIFPVQLPCEFRPLSGPVELPDAGRLTWFPLVHHGGSIGMRLDWPGHSMAYVTDTTAQPNADYLPLIRGVKLLVHECYFPDSQADFARQTGHTFTSSVAEVARRAEVGQLVLVHVNPASEDRDPVGVDVARAIFPNTEVGEDRMELDF